MERAARMAMTGVGEFRPRRRVNTTAAKQRLFRVRATFPVAEFQPQVHPPEWVDPGFANTLVVFRIAAVPSHPRRLLIACGASSLYLLGRDAALSSERKISLRPFVLLPGKDGSRIA
jgi:hypothetical protein